MKGVRYHFVISKRGCHTKISVTTALSGYVQSIRSPKAICFFKLIENFLWWKQPQTGLGIVLRIKFSSPWKLGSEIKKMS